jgi:hypothetical protein
VAIVEAYRNRTCPHPAGKRSAALRVGVTGDAINAVVVPVGAPDRPADLRPSVPLGSSSHAGADATDPATTGFRVLSGRAVRLTRSRGDPQPLSMRENDDPMMPR